MPSRSDPGLSSGAYALLFVVVCLLVYILHAAAAIMIPFMIAVFVWYLINAIARVFGRLSLPRFLCFAMACLLLLLGLGLIVTLVSKNISDVIRAAPVYQQNFEKVVPRLVSFFHLEHEPTIRDLLQYVDLGGTMTALAKAFTGFAGKTLVVLFYLGFLLYEQRFFDRKIAEMIVDPHKERRVRSILKNIDTKIQRYIGVKSLASAFDSVMTFVILGTFHVDFAGFWGLMAFFLHFIPYAGSAVAITLPTTIALIQFGDAGTAAAVLACLAVSHAFIGHVLDPYLMGNNLNLSPIFIISSLAMWGMIWGVPGMFLAVPILATIAIVASQVPAARPFAILLSRTGVIDGDAHHRP